MISYFNLIHLELLNWKKSVFLMFFGSFFDFLNQKLNLSLIVNYKSVSE